jgi:hypothetical protein
VVELHEEAEAYQSRKTGAFDAWEKYSVRCTRSREGVLTVFGQPEMRELLFEIVAPVWCRMGYDRLRE